MMTFDIVTNEMIFTAVLSILIRQFPLVTLAVFRIYLVDLLIHFMQPGGEKVESYSATNCKVIRIQHIIFSIENYWENTH